MCWSESWSWLAGSSRHLASARAVQKEEWQCDQAHLVPGEPRRGCQRWASHKVQATSTLTEVERCDRICTSE